MEDYHRVSMTAFERNSRQVRSFA